MSDPLTFLRTAEAGTLLLIAAGVALAIAPLFPRLRTKHAPAGMISLELAFSPKRAESVIDAWRQKNRLGAARRSLLTDLIFIVSYALMLGMLATLAGRAAFASNLFRSSEANTIAAALAICGWTAAVLDVAENIGLWIQLGERGPSVARTTATSTASAAKWFLAIGSALSSLAVLIASVF